MESAKAVPPDRRRGRSSRKLPRRSGRRATRGDRFAAGCSLAFCDQDSAPRALVNSVCISWHSRIGEDNNPPEAWLRTGGGTLLLLVLLTKTPTVQATRLTDLQTEHRLQIGVKPHARALLDGGARASCSALRREWARGRQVNCGRRN